MSTIHLIKALIFLTSDDFEQSKRYGIQETEALEQVHKFNETGVLGFIPAYKDSVEYVTKFAREGWRFEVITMIGKDKFAHKLRQANLRHLFGDVFDYIYCAGESLGTARDTTVTGRRSIQQCPDEDWPERTAWKKKRLF